MQNLRLEIRKIVEQEIENEQVPVLRRTFSRSQIPVEAEEVDESIKTFYATGLSIDDLYNWAPQTINTPKN